MLHVNTSSKMFDTATPSETDGVAFPIVSRYERLGQEFSTQPKARERSEVAGLTDWQVKKVLRWIDAHVEQSIRITDLAALTRLSVSRFSKAFKISLGKPPYDYVLGRRIEAARYLISATNEPLSHIAHACGLSDQAHLSKVFKRQVGSTPRQYRLQYRATRQPTLFATTWMRLENPSKNASLERLHLQQPIYN